MCKYSLLVQAITGIDDPIAAVTKAILNEGGCQGVCLALLGLGEFIPVCYGEKACPVRDGRVTSVALGERFLALHSK